MCVHIYQSFYNMTMIVLHVHLDVLYVLGSRWVWVLHVGPHVSNEVDIFIYDLEDISNHMHRQTA